MTSSAKDELFIKEEFASKILTKLQACVGVGIYSLRLLYSDGSESPLLGSREPNTTMDISRLEGDRVTQQKVAVIKI